MKTMTFNGRTMREAIAQAKARFGADVDILDSGAVGDEVQVTVVVPEPRGVVRRRRAIAEMSSSINALAGSKGAAGRAAAGRAEPAGAAAARDATAAQATAPAARAGVQEGAADTAVEATVAAEGRSKGRVSRATKADKAPAGGRLARTVAAVAGRKGRRKVADDEAADAVPEAGTGADDAADAPAQSAAAVQDAAGPAASRAPMQESLVPEGPVSTLDFERLRRLRAQAGSGMGPQAGTMPAPPAQTMPAAVQQQAATVASMLPQHGGRIASADGMPHDAVAAAQAVPGQFSGFAALMREQQQAMQQADLRAAAAGHAASAAPPASAASAAQAQARAAAIAAHAQQAPKSRLWQMVDSARRLFGRKQVWNTPDAEAQIQAMLAGAQQPMSLASTLDDTNGGWPVLQMPGTGGVPVAHGAVPHGFVQPAAQATAQGIGWFEATRRRPGQMRLLRNLLRCQFSPGLARTLVDLLPADYGDMQADEWLRQTLLRTLVGVNTSAGMSSLEGRGFFDQGGVFALIGPTGVGKTTSIAKIAAHHVLRHGPRQLALITADVYRIGAQEQLRAFGRMLGVPVQVAQDRDVLQALLKEHEGRSLVLIDTAGISQRDERVSQLTSALALSQVKRVLVMNAAAQPGSVEEMLEAFGARDTSGVLLSKVDEAVGLGSCMDALVRHRLPLVGYADGQRVPEDYNPANFVKLVDQALDADTASRYRSLSMTDSEMRQLFESGHV